MFSGTKQRVFGLEKLRRKVTSANLPACKIEGTIREQFVFLD